MSEEVGLISLGIFIGIMIGLPLWGGFVYEWGGVGDIKELGQSICEEEYGMDYESYYNDVLKCKPFKEKYDGIKVSLSKSQNYRLKSPNYNSC